MENATLRRHRLLSGGTLAMLAAAGMALMAIFAYSPGGSPSTTPVAVLASIGLVDDDGDLGLFNVSGMVPGSSTTRCVKVQYGGPATSGTVFFSAGDITGPLAATLSIKVEQGTGGGFASCAGFTGTVIYDGPLTSLVDPDPAAPQTTTGWSPAAGEERTYRLTATMNDNVSAQDQHSTATFTWFVFGGPTPTPSVTASPTPSVTASPTPSVTASPTPSVTATPQPSVTATVTPTATATATATATPEPTVTTTEPAIVEPTATVEPTVAVTDASPLPVAPTSTTADGGNPEPVAVSSAPRSAEPRPSRSSVAVVTAAETDKGPVAKARKALAELGRDITEVAVRTSSHSALPVTGLAVLLAFLAVQARFDRMDPKLAMAPVSDPHLHFHDPGTDPDTDPDRGPDADEAAP
jgi:hypothetical protein